MRLGYVDRVITRRVLLAAAMRAVRPRGFLFRARGPSGFLGAGDRTAHLRTDGTGWRVYEFNRPNEIGWGVSGFFDGRRALVTSIERNPDWDTKSFYEYYARSQTHIWILDVATGKITEIAQHDRVAPFYQVAALLPNEKGLLVTASINGKEVLYRIDLDGKRPRALTGPDEYVYGVALSPDATRVAFHANYRIQTMNVDGASRKEVAGERGMIYFGPQWSPNGDWLSYQVCDGKLDPGHDWSALWIARPDGSERRRLTQDAELWFGASYGSRDNPGGGSNIPRWSPGGELLFARRLPGAKVPWEFQANRPDTTHFNRDFKPELARGGTHLCAVDPSNGRVREVTPATEGQWDFRGEWSSDGRSILFCRAGVGENPAIWLAEGSRAHFLTRGINNRGADHPRWLPADPRG